VVCAKFRESIVFGDDSGPEVANEYVIAHLGIRQILLNTDRRDTAGSPPSTG